MTAARHDRAHCTAPGLFRSERRGNQRNRALRVHYEYNDTERIEFLGPTVLGADDLRVLEGLVARATANTQHLGATTNSLRGKQLLRPLLEGPRPWDLGEDGVLIVECTYPVLAREIGFKDIYHPSGLRASIARLGQVEITVQTADKVRRFDLLHDYAAGSTQHDVQVALNPRITKAVVHDEGDGFTAIDMDQVRALSSGPARILHQRLCGAMDIGESKEFKLSTIMEYLWGDKPCPSRLVRSRRAAVRTALDELAKVGWTWTVCRTDIVQVTRPGNSPGHMLHQRLCRVLDIGCAATIALPTLLGYLSAKSKSKSTGARAQRARVQEALNELDSVGWRIIESEPDKFKIERPVGTPAHILYEELCTAVTEGKRKTVTLEGMVRWVWRDGGAADRLDLRRAAVRTALSELEAVGWTITPCAAAIEKFTVRRPMGQPQRIPGAITTTIW